MVRWMCLAIWCPWAGPNNSVRRTSMSKVPCNNWIRSQDSFGIGDSRQSSRIRITSGRRPTVSLVIRTLGEKFTWTGDNGLEVVEHGGFRAPQRGGGTQGIASHPHGARGYITIDTEVLI